MKLSPIPHPLNTNPVKAVLFDLGETLLEFGRIKPLALFFEGARTSFNYLKELGEPVSCFAFYCIHSMVSLYLHRLISWITGNDFNAMELLKRIGSSKSFILSEEQWCEYAWCWYEPLERIGRVEEGIKETLGKLKDMGLKLAIVSNTFVPSSSLERHLKQMGILDFFDVRLYSYEFDFRKPDVRIFKAAVDRIGENVENTLFVGDRINTDIIPALKTGMYAVLKNAYTNAGKYHPPGALKIEKLSELPGLVEKINCGSAVRHPVDYGQR